MVDHLAHIICYSEALGHVLDELHSLDVAQIVTRCHKVGRENTNLQSPFDVRKFRAVITVPTNQSENGHHLETVLGCMKDVEAATAVSCSAVSVTPLYHLIIRWLVFM